MSLLGNTGQFIHYISLVHRRHRAILHVVGLVLQTGCTTNGAVTGDVNLILTFTFSRSNSPQFDLVT